MKIRTLQVDDAAALLEFELDNRAWFERFVLPRHESVYSTQGISAHIETCLEEFENGTMHPSVILDQGGKIVGRANLKDIDSLEKTTEIGYRIAQQYTGKGIASQAVRYLQELGYEKWRLKRLWAYVTTENAASARVLEKSGFVRGKLFQGRSELKGKTLDCYQYEHVGVCPEVKPETEFEAKFLG
jgi:ribosomal-protein-alanine N-acetyltransferase